MIRKTRPFQTARDIQHSHNFLTDGRLVRELIVEAKITEDDLVLEIGPGKGAITRLLQDVAGRVIAIEKDPTFEPALTPLSKTGVVELVMEDFLTWRLPRESFKVFSNIPFNATTDIVTKLTSSESLMTDMYVLMQTAAARRFAGAPVHANSQLSVLLGIDFDIRILRNVKRSSFSPRPKVDVCFAHFRRRKTPAIERQERQEFRDFVVYGFNRWAPTVRKAFKEIFSHTQLKLISKNQNIDVKPSDFSLEEWVTLFKTYVSLVSAEKRRLISGSEARLRKEQKKIVKWRRSRSF